MKMCLNKKIALILTLVLIVPIFWNQNTAVASAATPTLTQNKVEIVGAGETYQIVINSKVSGSKYKWTSSNTAVAKVTSKGLVTSVNKGTATVKCIITYPSKKTKTLSCKVTVFIPATEINISNATIVNGAHLLALGSSMDFGCNLVPATSSDKTYWSIGGGDIDCIRIDDSSEGKVTGIKSGKVILVATAAKTATKQAADLSIVNDAIIIEVVGPSATVKSADISGSTEIKVVFDSPVNSSTVLGQNGKLSENIEITMRKDTKGVLSSDPGALTATLSTDLKTLTIISEKMFDGEYGINFTNKILTADGIALVPYYKQISYTDTIPPAIMNVELDDSGMISIIHFTEAIDFTNFNVTNATVVTNNTTAGADPETIRTLNNKLNYVVSADKKSLTINLSKISYSDYGKLFTVIFSGIKDLNGNIPTNFTMMVYLNTDITLKPQIRPISIVRTSYNILTTTFDRTVKTPGMIQVNGGAAIAGVIDPINSKKVNYTISDAEAQYIGVKTVAIGFWSGYNIISSDTYASQMRDFGVVDFTADRTSPMLLTYEFDAATSILTLTYNEDINIAQATGIFSSTLVTVSEDIKSGTNINYTKEAYTENSKVIKLKMTNMTILGNYTFTMDLGFATDNFRNSSISRVVTISNTTGALSELPGPYAIIQSTTNLSEIYLQFAHKLDVASAETISNYSIPGVTILSAKVKDNTSDNGATVILTVADGSIIATVERPITITGLKGYNGSYTAITTYPAIVNLKDNKKPELLGQPVFDSTARNVIKINFNEQIQGGLLVKVTQIGSTVPIEILNTVTINSNSAYITLANIPTNAAYLRIDILTNNITDVSGNAALLPSTLGVLAAY